MKLAIVLAATAALAVSPALAQTNTTGGSGGTASSNGTSASTLGVGARSTSGNQTSTALGMGAAAAGGSHQQARAAVHGNNNLNGQAMAQAHDGGTFSKSHTVCHNTDCRIKTMAHVPGEKPVKSTSTSSQ
ncbi:MAG: hypothetical protein JO256_01435 [Alphaproteobacteria bacterium]|nr:hypothetical protein [Alphaproteobacteria bacterium]